MTVTTYRQVQRRTQGTGRPDPLGYSRPPVGGFWIPREFHEWPEVQSLSNADLGTFVRCAMWSHDWDGEAVRPDFARWWAGGTRGCMERIAAAGLWAPSTNALGQAAFAVRTIADLRTGRGRPGLLLTIDSRFPSSPESHRAEDALGAWARAASWSLGTEYPGLIPAEMELSFGSRSDRASLIRAGLWEPEFGGSWMSVGDHPLAARWALIRDDERALIDPALREFIYARDGYRCAECGTAGNLSLDHIIPWSIGGPDTEDNLQTLCRPCNSSKGARY